MDKIIVDPLTLKNLSNFLSIQNEKIGEIIKRIDDTNREYQDMLISNTGELFWKVMLKEQEQIKNEIALSNQNIVEKLSLFSDIYKDAYDKINEGVK